MVRKRNKALQALRFASTHGRDSGTCSLCERLDTYDIVEETAHMVVMENQIPYDVFVASQVDKHLLIVPKQHREMLSQFSDDEQREYVMLLAKYDDLGFSSYTRSISNTARSQSHYHTHLLRTAKGMVRAFLYWEKPYILLFRKPKTTKKA